MRTVAVLCALAVLAGTTQRHVEAQGPPPTVASLLHAAGNYLAQSDADGSGIVADEDYVQKAGADTRRLRSDFVVTADPIAGVVEFRDVLEVDGVPVSDRRNRLESLLTAPGQDPLKEARRLSDESARFNLSARNAPAIDRTVNLPRLALAFLRTANQGRSRFSLAGVEQIGTTSAAVLRFEETAKPRIIQSPIGAAAQGRFWVDPADGRVLQTEVSLDTPISITSRIQVAMTVHVSYAVDARLRVSVPVTMDEQYDIWVSVTSAKITGHATYSNFRRFQAEGRIVQ